MEDDPDDAEGISAANSMLRSRPSLGSVLSSLMLADKREISHAFSRNSSTAERLEYLFDYVKCLSSNKGTIEQICVPLLQDPANRKKALLILQWLLRKPEARIPVMNTLAHILCSSGFDRSTKLAGSLIVKELINSGGCSDRALQEHTTTVFQAATVFSPCLPHLVALVRDASVKNGNTTLPTRLTIAAADCSLAITKFLSCAQGTNLDRCGFILWNHLKDISALVDELYKWNCEPRPLFASGLVQVKNQLHQIAASQDKNVSSSVLRLCWKEYGNLMISDSHLASPASKNFQRLSTALENYIDEDRDGDKSRSKMRCFFLTCIALLLGHLDADQIDSLLLANGEFFEILLCQISQDFEEETVTVAVAILKFLLFKARISDETRKSFFSKAEESFVKVLDKTIATAVVDFVAEYFLLYPTPDLQRLFVMIDSKITTRRRNGIRVLGALVQKLCDSTLSSLSQIIATYLLKRLDDEELITGSNATVLFMNIDPSSVMPSLISLLYDSNEKVQRSSRSILFAVLKQSRNQEQAVSIFLNCARKISSQTQTTDSTADIDRVLALFASWASTIKNWDSMSVFLVEKMFSDPSNPILPRFLSEISSNLADANQFVFARALREMVNASTSSRPDVFQNLSPLLVLKLLPLRAYDAVECEELYSSSQGLPSLTSMLVEWMCTSEFDHIRKLSAELSGRLLPEVLLPLVIDELRKAVENTDILRIKSCLYSICNSFMTRGCQDFANPLIKQIKVLLTTILLWPTSSEDVQKAQHGCIDSFAVMIRAEFKIPGEECRVLNAVLSCLQDQPDAIASLCGMSQSEFSSSVVRGIKDANYASAPVSFRLCMANVLISSSSKIEASFHDEFCSRVVSTVLKTTESESIVRAASLQVLFSTVFNSKGAASLGLYAELLDASLRSLDDDNALDEERVAAAKLLASLLVHESVLEKAAGLSMVRVAQVLSRVSCSPEVRKICEKLLIVFRG